MPIESLQNDKINLISIMIVKNKNVDIFFPGGVSAAQPKKVPRKDPGMLPKNTGHGAFIKMSRAGLNKSGE